MHSVVRQCWIALPGAAIALAAMFCWANPAKAECGDYVRIGSDPMTQSMPLTHSGPAAPADHPSCHRGQDVPLIPPVPAPVPVSDLFCSIAFVSTPSPARSGRMDLSELNDPVDFPSDIFHPPKPLRG